MTEIQSNLNSPAWWFSAVVIALLINLVSSYAKPWTDNLFQGVGHRWRTRTEVKRNQFEEQVRKNVANPVMLEDSVQRELRSRQRAIFFILLGLFLISIGTVSGHQTGKSTSFAGATALDLVFFTAQMFGFAAIAMSLTFMTKADRLEDVITRANKAKLTNESPVQAAMSDRGDR
jgi:hypothetical protein